MYSFYINLDSRTDRRHEFESEGIPAERFSAIRHSNPAIGCTRSHLEVIKLAKERNYPYVVVFEDDFTFSVTKDKFDSIVASCPADYDVVMLDYYILKSEPYNEDFDRVLEAQAASAYIVNARFYDTLLANYEEAVRLFEMNPEYHWLYINDQYWKHLQPLSRWYMSRVRVGRQRPGYSDLKQAVLANEY